jgi:hypothetical protein
MVERLAAFDWWVERMVPLRFDLNPRFAPKRVGTTRSTSR